MKCVPTNECKSYYLIVLENSAIDYAAEQLFFYKPVKV